MFMNEQFSKEKINEVKDAALGKADELYNQLPLDKINDKLGGKVDVKSKKFKLIAAGSVLGVLALVVVGIACLIFGGDPDPVWVNDEPQNELNFINALSDEQKREYFLIEDFCFSNDLGQFLYMEKRDGKKYSELIGIWREKLGEENCDKLDEFIDNAAEDAHEKSMNSRIRVLEHYAWVHRDGKKMLSEKYNAECVTLTLSGWNTGDTTDTVWIDAKAVFRKKSGQEFSVSFEVTTGRDRKLLLFTPKK